MTVGGMMLGMPQRWRMGWIVAVTVALGLALRLWFVAHALPIAGDTLLYGGIARNWMRAGVYGFGGVPLRPTLIRLPGYPMFLVASFRMFGVEHYTAVMRLQVLIDLGTWGLVAGLTGRLLGRRPGMAALVLGMLCPFPASYVANVLAETLTLFTIALAFFSLERWGARGGGWNRWLVPIGFALGYGLLLRPEQGLLAAVVVPAMAWMRWSRGAAARWGWWGPMLAVSVITLLPLVPWTVRNWRTFHVIEPLAPRSAEDPGELVPRGFERWYRTWGVDFVSTDDVYWTFDGGQIAMESLPARAFDSAEQRERTARLLADYDVTTNATPEIDRRFGEIAEERVRGHWLRYYVALPAARLADMMLRPRTENLPVETRWWEWRDHPGQTAFAVVWVGLNLMYFVLGAWGVWREVRGLRGRGRVVVWAMVGFCVVRGALLLTLDNAETRYTLEFFPLLVVGCAGWLAGLRGTGLGQIPPLRS